MAANLQEMKTRKLWIIISCVLLLVTIHIVLFARLLMTDNALTSIRNIKPFAARGALAFALRARSTPYSAEADCTKWSLKSDAINAASPAITLDSSKFLYPGFLWGPNNQMIEFWHAIYIAIRLNRTIVLPAFYAHFSVGGGILTAHQRVDIQRLCSFVSCATIKDLQEKCQGCFDAAFVNHAVETKFVRMVEEATNLKILHRRNPRYVSHSKASKLRLTDYHQSIDDLTIPTFPISHFTRQTLPSDGILRRLFNTSAPCVFYLSSFEGLDIVPENNFNPANAAITQPPSALNDRMLYSYILDAAQKPLCIKDAARQYIRAAFRDHSYIGVHWRYNKEDWMEFYCGRSDMKNMCETIKSITVEDVAKAVLEHVPMTLDRIYISSPQSEAEFTRELLQLLRHRFSAPSLNLNSFLLETFQPCWIKAGWVSAGDIISFAEMEVMQHSEMFFYSAGSTWSENTELYRKLQFGERTARKDFSILSISTRHVALRKQRELANRQM